MSRKILIIDNYDSFTYNLYQYVGELNPNIEVVRNDKLSIEDIDKMAPSHIIVSPGPGFPKDAGMSIDIIKAFGAPQTSEHKSIPILGVCLGHQAIGEAFGGRIVHARQLIHGKATDVSINNECKLFKGLDKRITVGRYHSLIVENESLPKCLEITATDDCGEIMGVMHKDYPVFGIQFHPESILTPTGKQMLKSFLEIYIA